jgi:hypothetical protein
VINTIKPFRTNPAKVTQDYLVSRYEYVFRDNVAMNVPTRMNTRAISKRVVTLPQFRSWSNEVVYFRLRCNPHHPASINRGIGWTQFHSTDRSTLRCLRRLDNVSFIVFVLVYLTLAPSEISRVGKFKLNFITRNAY